MPAYAAHTEPTRRPLRVGSVTDPAERAADRVADRIMTGGLSSVPFDFGRVRVHHDDAAARSVGALAYAYGRDVVLGDAARHSPRVLAHELGHVVAEAGQPAVLRRFTPEEAADFGAMIGQSMVLAEDFTDYKGDTVVAGQIVVVEDWVNSSTTVGIKVPGRRNQPVRHLVVPKYTLRPAPSGVPEIAPYGAEVDVAASRVVRGNAALAAERGRPDGSRADEINRIEFEEQPKRDENLNRRLIQETMFNRFDASVKRWTDYYNAQYGYTGRDALDPNIVKAMLYRESKMGTSGEHLHAPGPGSHPMTSQFNIMQAIDSGAMALLTIMEEMAPALITKYHLGDMRKDLDAAQGRRQKLSRMASRTPAEEADLAELTRVAEPNWERFLWEYKAAGQPKGFAEAVADFFTSTSPPRHLDYDFWIRTAVRWLFEKRQISDSWAEALYNYNGGSGDYRDEVLGRAASAGAAQRAGMAYVPPELVQKFR